MNTIYIKMNMFLDVLLFSSVLALPEKYVLIAAIGKRTYPTASKTDAYVYGSTHSEDQLKHDAVHAEYSKNIIQSMTISIYGFLKFSIFLCLKI